MVILPWTYWWQMISTSRYSNCLPQFLWEFIQFADLIWLMPWCKLRSLRCLLTWVKSFARGYYDKWPNYACLLFVRYQMIRSNLISYSSNHISVRWLLTLCCCKKLTTTLQSIMNAKLSQHRFWPCHENRLIKTIQMTHDNPYVSIKLTSLYCGLS